MPLFKARVLVSLRSSVLDPAGEAAKDAAKRLGVQGIKTLRIGKAIDLEIEASNESEVKQRLDLISDRLLANPVIENWRLDEINSQDPSKLDIHS